MPRVILTDEERRVRRADTQRRNYAKSAEKRRAARKQREVDPARRDAKNARQRDYYAKNRDRMRAYAADWRDRNPGRDALQQLMRRHGREIADDFPAMWDAQAGLCYLCGRDLDAAKTHIDHDHSCCPARRSCRACRRGLSCGPCNSMLGFANDDPDRLRLIAVNLERVLGPARERIAAKATAGTLF